MRIETDPKLDFEDVLIRPKRSTLNSREEVNLDRSFITKFSEKAMSGIPIIAANMDTIGTFDMAKELAGDHMYTAIHKHYTVEQLSDFFTSYAGLSPYVFYTLGSSATDLTKFKQLNNILINTLGHNPVQNICMDVANGYTQHFIDAVKRFRDQFSDKTIMAGNVVTAEMTEELILAGTDIVKIGIGPGCFIAGTLIITDSGLKPIEEVAIGDKVKTHKNNWKKVSKTFKYNENEQLISINGIKSTKSHEYYVIHKKYKDLVTDENIHEYAEWIPAKLLSKEYLLLRGNNK